ncbi:KH domain-containing, RNA-binding, signal transduction-associated protein 1 [Plakobranchus ocellatus]|uniref:KH domain-containing, RNA-binding, signal transduction-associated protein 1 n=1 Tax=Plakobranchus ocellatus TaxID=259542 RepID=A0AAV3YE37_9GAST|nr:KH domain-containing, RNA-binding, signal transduction-associated protein 1 [Plakobranchus ocellatus]
MATSGSYIEELENELKQTDPNSHANRLVTQEIDRLNKGEDDKKDRPQVPFLDLHHDKPQKCSVRVKIPTKEYPKYNFVGKLLGPKGSTLKALQDQTGCKMAIMGRGSMREKEKEEELRKQGGKYAHLNEELHVSVECYTEALDGHHRLAAALMELKKFIVPEMNEEMYGGGDASGLDMGMNGGAPRGRGGYRGAPPERGRGTFRGRGNGHMPPAVGRGGPPRGGQRGGPVARGGPAPRGAPGPAARGARAPAPAPTYDAYGGQQSYSSVGYSTGYDSTYDESYGQDASYYDYGQTGAGATGYDSYSSTAAYSDYSEGWSTGGAGVGGGGKVSAAPTRGTARGPSRAHPYSRPGAATGGY